VEKQFCGFARFGRDQIVEAQRTMVREGGFQSLPEAGLISTISPCGLQRAAAKGACFEDGTEAHSGRFRSRLSCPGKME